MRRAWWIYLLLISCQSLAQERDQFKLDRDEWERITKGIDYSGEKEEIKLNEPNIKMPWFLPGLFENLGRPAKILLIVSFTMVLTFLVYRIFRNALEVRSRGKDKLKQYKLKNLDSEDIDLKELRRLFDEMKEAGEFRLAFRIYYSLLIREMDVSGLIKWKKNKTNHQYLAETRESPIFSKFQYLTRLFEWYWYGERSLNVRTFSQLEIYLNEIHEAIESQIPNQK